MDLLGGAFTQNEEDGSALEHNVSAVKLVHAI